MRIQPQHAPSNSYIYYNFCKYQLVVFQGCNSSDHSSVAQIITIAWLVSQKSQLKTCNRNSDIRYTNQNTC